MTAVSKFWTLVAATLTTLITTAALLVAHPTQAQAATSISVSKGGVSLKVSVTCPSNGTTVTKISSTGGNPGYAARVRSSSGTWYQGAERSSGTATVYIAAQKSPAHGVRVFWASGAQNYTFC
jgi:hypothetical protein